MELAAVVRGEDGRTRLHLTFAPAGSCFVVLRAKATEGIAPAPTFVPEEERVWQLDGPWRVSFPPKFGGPAEVTLARTESWTENAEPGVRYFSGTATYHRQFTATAEDIAAPRRLMLDLGRVEKSPPCASTAPPFPRCGRRLFAWISRLPCTSARTISPSK